MKRAALLVLLLSPAAAHAHLVSTGIGPFYDGVAHLFVSVQDLLLCLGIGLLAGLSGKTAARAIVLSGAAAWLVGAVLGMLGVVGLVSPVAELAAPVMLLGIGALAALDARLPAALVVSLTTVAAMLLGLSNGMALAPLGFTGILGLFAAFVVVVLLTAASVVGIRLLWARTAVRVAGSWIGAVGLLLLGWSLRPLLE